MELNTQRTVSGLALLSRSAGDSGWERPHMALPGEPLAQHRPGCPPTRHHCPLQPPCSSACSPPCAAASLARSGPGHPLCVVHQQPESPGAAARGSTAPALLLFTASLRDLRNTRSPQTCNEAVHDSTPGSSAATGTRSKPLPGCLLSGDSPVLEKAPMAAVATQAQRQPCALVCL